LVFVQLRIAHEVGEASSSDDQALIIIIIIIILSSSPRESNTSSEEKKEEVRSGGKSYLRGKSQYSEPSLKQRKRREKTDWWTGTTYKDKTFLPLPQGAEKHW
jgi:hypothetical protein